MDWKEFMYFTKQDFGEDSPEYQATLPDTVIFRKYYKFNFIAVFSFSSKDYSQRDCHFHRNYYYFPMIGISYEQTLEYCKFRSRVHTINNHKRVDSVVFTLPTKEEIKLAEQFAEITYYPPLNPLSEKKKVHGLYDNVEEYILNDKKENYDGPVGFRCVAILY